jgi:hypothetical protein
MFKCINFSLPTTKAIAEKIAIDLNEMITPRQVALIWDIWLNEDFENRKSIEPTSKDILEIYANFAVSSKQEVLNSEKIKDQEKVVDFLQSLFFTLLEQEVGSPLITREDIIKHKTELLKAFPKNLREQGFPFIADNFEHYRSYLESQRLSKFSMPETSIEDMEFKEKDQVSSQSSSFYDNKHKASDEAVYLIASLTSDEEIYGLPKPLNFSETWNIIQNLLADSLDFEDQINILEENRNTYPFINQLLNKLGISDGIQIDSERHIRVGQSFSEAFLKQFSDISIATTSGKDSYSSIDGQTENSLKEKFKNKFFSSKNVVKINGSLVTNIDAYRKLELKGFSEAELKTFLEFFGIPSDIEFNDDIKADLRQIKKQVDGAKSMIWLDDNDLDIKGRLSSIIKLFVPQEQANKNLSTLNAEGKQQYAIHNANYFSRFVTKLKKGRIEAKNYFDKVFSLGIAKKEIISGLQDDKKINTSVFSDLSLTDIAHTVITNMFSNNPIIHIPRVSDKSQEKGFKLETEGNNDDFMAFTKISNVVLKNLYNLYNQDINETLHPDWIYYNKEINTPEAFWKEIGIERGVTFEQFKSKILEFVNSQKEETKKMLEDLGVIYQPLDKYGEPLNIWKINFSNAAVNKILNKNWENANFSERDAALNTLINNFTFNMFYWSVGYTKSIYGSLVMTKPSNMFKRFSAAVAEGRQVSLSPNLNQEIARDYKKHGLLNHIPTQLKVYIHSETISASTTKDLNKISESYDKNNVDDAQGIILFPVYRTLLKGVNQWTDNQEEAYQKLMKGEKINKNVFPPLKPVGYSLVNIDGKKVPVFIKTSIYPISPADTLGTYNGLKYEYAIENGVSLFIPTSGIKIAIPKGTSPVISDGVVSNNPTVDFPIEDFRIQLDLNVKTSEDLLQGTQQRKLIFANAFSGGKAVDSKYEEIKNKYIDTLEKLASIEEKKLFERLGVENTKDGVIINNLSLLKDMLRSDMISNEMSMNVVNSINEVINSEGQLVGKIDTLPERQKIMNLLNSFITNNLIRLYINGTSLVQASNQGWEITTPDGPTSIDFISKEHQKKYYENKGLKFFELGDKTGAAEVLLPAKYKKFVKKNEEGDYIIDDEKVLINIGYRIPTQGHNSILHLRVVGFIPAHLDQLIIVPKEITTQGGSDFDVDKLNLFIPNTINLDGKIQYISEDMNGSEIYDKKKEKIEAFIKYLENGIERAKLEMEQSLGQDEAVDKLMEAIFGSKASDVNLTKQDIEEILEFAGYRKNELDIQIKKLLKLGEKDKFIENFKIKQLENILIQSTVDILSDPYFRKSLLTPNSANQLSSAAQEMTDNLINAGLKTKKPVLSFGNIFKANTLINTIYQMFASKALVGVFASQSTHHTLAQQVGLHFKSGRKFFFEHNKLENGDMDLSAIYDKDGNEISDVLGNNLLTAAVDAAKDDYLTELGINLQTGDFAAAFKRAGGKSQYLFHWLRLPIIQDYLAEEAKNESILYKSSNRVVSKSKLIDKVLKKYNLSKDSSEYVQTKYKNKAKGKELNEFREKRGEYTVDELKKLLFSNESKHPEMLMDLFDEFLFFKDAAIILRKSIATSKFDTAGPGKNLVEAKSLQYSYNKFVSEMKRNDEYTLGTLLNGETAPYERLINETVLKVFFPNSFPLVLNLYKPLTVMGLNNSIEKLLDSFINSEYGIVKKIPESFTLDIVYSAITNYMVQNSIGYEESLFFGDNTLGHRLNEIQKDETHPLYYNDFIQNFFNIELSRDAVTPTILSPIKKRLSAEDQNHFTGQLEEIKEYDNKLYEDIIKVSLFQTGFQQSPVSFYNIIPGHDMIPLVNKMILNAIDITDQRAVEPIIQNISNKLNEIKFVQLSNKAFVLPNGELQLTDEDIEKVNRLSYFNSKYGIFKFNGMGFVRVETKNHKSLFYNYTKEGIEFENMIDDKLVFENEESNEFSETDSIDIQPENISSKDSEFDKKLNQLIEEVADEVKNSDNSLTLTDILTEKLKQNPELVQGINKRGGLAYIEQSTNNVIEDKFWETGSIKEREYTPENITTLKPNEVFVFGANTAGGHGGGTAGLAQRGTTSSNYTALPIGTKGKWSEYGVVDKLMQGTEGKSFGIVTKAATITGTTLKIGSKRSVPLSRIEESIDALIKTANENPNLKFLVTKFGTNMAGFSEQEMKSLLKNKSLPDNIVLPKEFETRSEFTGQNKFIEALAQAYKNVINNQNTNTVNDNDIDYKEWAEDNYCPWESEEWNREYYNNCVKNKNK